MCFVEAMAVRAAAAMAVRAAAAVAVRTAAAVARAYRCGGGLCVSLRRWPRVPLRRWPCVWPRQWPRVPLGRWPRAWSRQWPARFVEAMAVRVVRSKPHLSHLPRVCSVR